MNLILRASARRIRCAGTHSSRRGRRRRRESSSEELSSDERSRRRYPPPPPPYRGRPPAPPASDQPPGRRPYRGGPREPYRPPPARPPRPNPESRRGGRVNRFPQELHSPVSTPSASVVKRSGAPHWRHGRALGGASPPPPSRRRGRSYDSRRSRGARGLPVPSGTKVVVVSHSVQLTSRVPSSRAEMANGEPHSAHSGAPGVAEGVSGARTASPAAGFGVPMGSGPSTSVVTRWQSAHVPVSTRVS
jgi:hypothetical protein